jgi:uncharacterized membrane protein
MLGGSHLHLIINHAPVVLFALALLLLLFALFKRDQMLTQIALLVTIGSALLCWAAMLTGPGAVAGLSGYEHNHPAMSAHAKFGRLTTYAGLFTGLLALSAFWAVIVKRARPLPWLTCVAASVFVMNLMLTATATLGGAVTHAEIAGDGLTQMIGDRFGLHLAESEQKHEHD